MVLLQLLKVYADDNQGHELIVAHYDHGIRSDSYLDRQAVEEKARLLSLKFRYAEGRLGPDASEQLARTARYAFLDAIASEQDAESVVTAHHQDDLIETAIINIMRGSGRKGLTSLRNRPGRYRPLLGYTKGELTRYALAQGIAWREDPTNDDTAYLRNYVRRRIVPRLNREDRERLLGIIGRLEKINADLDKLLSEQLARQAAGETLDRTWFSQLPHNVSREVMASWLRSSGISSFDRKSLERLVVAAKTGHSGRQFPVANNRYMNVKNHNLALDGCER